MLPLLIQFEEALICMFKDVYHLKEDEMQKGNPWALIPFVVFLFLFIGSGVVLNDFYAFPVTVAISIASAVALLMNRKETISEKIEVFTTGAGKSNIMLMVIIFLLAGAFSETAKGMGAIEATVNFALSILPQNLLVIGLFIIACFISLAMGTSVGTIVALAPIGLAIGEQTGLSVPLLMATIIGGAMFGDNLSFISDTTIASVRSQGAEMKDKFKVNFLIVLPAAIVTCVILVFLTLNTTAEVTYASFDWYKVVPYLFVIVFALIGTNVLTVLTSGIIFAGMIGFIDGSYNVLTFIQAIGNGMSNMFEMAFLAILIGGMVEVIKHNGGIDFIVHIATRKIKSQKDAQFAIAGLVGLTDLATANNTIAIMISGPIAKKIADQHDIEPSKSASIIDIFSCVVQGIIPYGAQFLAAASIAGISPILIMQYSYYSILVGVCGIIAILIGYPRTNK